MWQKRYEPKSGTVHVRECSPLRKLCQSPYSKNLSLTLRPLLRKHHSFKCGLVIKLPLQILPFTHHHNLFLIINKGKKFKKNPLNKLFFLMKWVVKSSIWYLFLSKYLVHTYFCYPVINVIIVIRITTNYDRFLPLYLSNTMSINFCRQNWPRRPSSIKPSNFRSF